jgi:hypothetical protein
MQRSMSMTKSFGSFSTSASGASSGRVPGVMRIALGGHTNSHNWHETHFTRPSGSFTNVGTPRYAP